MLEDRFNGLLLSLSPSSDEESLSQDISSSSVAAIVAPIYFKLTRKIS